MYFRSGRRRSRARRLSGAAALVRDDAAVRLQPGRSDAAEPWLPPARPTGRDLTVEAQEADPRSMLHLYRDVLAIRRREPGPRRRPAALAALGAGRPRVPARRRLRVRHQPLRRADRPLPVRLDVLLASADARRRPPARRRDGLGAPGRPNPRSTRRASRQGAPMTTELTTQITSIGGASSSKAEAILSNRTR